MSKNKNQSVSPEARLAALQKEIEAVNAEVKGKEIERVNKLAAQIDELPKQFGVTNLDEVSALIRRRSKGTLGSIETAASGSGNRSRVTLDDATWKTIFERVKTGGAGNQRSEICNEFGIHPQTLQNRLSNAGMVKTRGNVTTPVAPMSIAAMTQTANDATPEVAPVETPVAVAA